MTRYMLDTSIVSHLLREQPAVVRHVTSISMAALCMSAITEGELLFGLSKRPAARQLHVAVRELLRRVEVLPWDSVAAECYGVVRAAMTLRGKVITPLDLLIATHAQSINAVLVTNDRAIRQMSSLQIEDWTH